MNWPAWYTFMKAVCAHPNMSPAHRLVLICLGLCYNIKTGRCDPSVQTLMVGTGFTRRTVQEALAEGEKVALILRDIGGGRNHTSQYKLVSQETAHAGAPISTETVHHGAPLTAETAHQRAPIIAETAHGDARNSAPRRAKQRTSVRPNNKNIEENREEKLMCHSNGASMNGVDNTYAFEGQVIRLLPAQLKKWQGAYPDIPNIAAELQHADDYYAGHPPENGEWFHRVSAWLKRENGKWVEKRRAADRERDSW
jgi:hypothetical protein